MIYSQVVIRAHPQFKFYWTQALTYLRWAGASIMINFSTHTTRLLPYIAFESIVLKFFDAVSLFHYLLQCSHVMMIGST